ncbi:uncharacterized protein LOC109791667 [Cajanus cajan]|uniref:uncharacterized protein LOC109791667 n=1 Tax=Cajanus cajan TaxID=3821 RepID=UPI00098D8F45|nr:uncharacterized protein LOC109791667 [Cajanus cajan]
MDEATLINLDNFKSIFLEKYFPNDVKSQKEVEVLKLKLGDDTVVEYTAKFGELVHYCSHYHGEDGERVKCIKFVNGLLPEVKMVINYQEIYHYPMLINKCRIYDYDNRAHATFYKGDGFIYDGRFGGQSRSKPYLAFAKFQGNRARDSGSKSTSRGFFMNSIVSVRGFVSTPIDICKKCGQCGYEHYNCLNKEIMCFNYNGKGHISIQCLQSPRSHLIRAGASSQSRHPKTIGIVFSLSDVEATQSKNLIQVVESPTNGLITTSNMS